MAWSYCWRRKNVRWEVADATELQLPAGSADVVFSNWLLMYLSDSEVAKLAGDALSWVISACWHTLPAARFAVCRHLLMHRCHSLWVSGRVPLVPC